MIATFGRYLFRTLLALFALAFLCVASVYLILDTQRGSDWLLHRGLALVSPEAEFTSYSGSLARGIQLEGLHIPLDGIDIQLGQLDSSWNLWGVLSGSLAINKLHLDELRIKIDASATPTAEPSAAPPGPWPSLSLPIAIAIDDLKIAQLELIQGSDIQNIEQINLSAALGLTRSKIKTLKIQTATQRLNMHGRINNTPPYPMDINVDWETSTEEFGALSGKAQLSGDLRELQLSHRLNQPALLDSKAKVRLPYRAEHMVIDYREIQLSLNNQWHNFKTSALTSSELALQSTGSLTIEGSWQDYQLNLDTTISADGQHHPQKTTPAPASTAQISASTAPDMASILNAVFKEPGQFAAKLSGNQLSIAIAKLDAKTAVGELAVNGKVNANNFLNNTAASAKQALQWQLAITAKNLDSRSLTPQWPAHLSAKLNSNGRWQGDRYQLSVDIESLNGDFLARTAQGSGQIRLSERGQEFKQLKLQLGDNHLQLHGKLAETSSLDWQLDAQNLGQILPELSGALTSEGSLRGGPLATLLGPLSSATKNTPQIIATASATKLQYLAYSIAQADLEAKLSADQSLTLKVNATELNVGPLTKADMELNGTGSLENHKLAFKVADRNQQIELSLSGGLGTASTSAKTKAQTASATWHGHIEHLAVNHPMLGPWFSKAPSSLRASATEIQLGELCLVQEQDSAPASLCVALNFNDDTIKLNGDIQGLSLNRFSAGLPPGSSLQGKVDSEFNVAGKLDQLTGQFALTAAPILIHYQAGVDEAALEHHASLSANASLKDNQIRSEMAFVIAEVGSMNGTLNTRGLDPGSAIEGSVSSQFDNLLWLGGFFPELEKLDGSLNADLAINGSVAAPALVGAVGLDNLHMQLPAIGLALNSGSASLHLANAGDWQLDAGISSGAGRINLIGQGVFEPSNGPTGNIAISGENFTAVDLADAKVLISPDINISLAAELIKIRGSLAIPQGNFTLKSLPAQASSVSADEVIISSKSAPTIAATRAIDTQVTISLNDSFQFTGYGLSTRFGGKLKIVQKSQAAVQAFGSLSLYDGVYKAYGQDLSIQRGLLLFQGPVDNPGLNITAVREVEPYRVGINIGGFAQDIRSDLFSDPTMPPTDVISMLITGKAPGAMSQSDANQVMNAATSLGISQSKGITSTLQSTFGMDVLNFQGGDSYEESSLVVGKYLTPSIFISYVQNLFTPAGSVQLDYTLSKSLGLKAQSGETQSIDLLYRVEHGKD